MAREQVSSDEAFEVIADKLEYMENDYEIKALVAHLGNPFIGYHVPMMAQRLCSLYGTPNYPSVSKTRGLETADGKAMQPLKLEP